jgi:cold shock CspA family protein
MASEHFEIDTTTVSGETTTAAVPAIAQEDATIYDLSEKSELPYGEFIGYCKWFNNRLGYGFIRIGSGHLLGKDIFVHHSGLKPLNSTFKTLFKGEYVHCTVVDSKDDKQAVAMDVTGIFGGPLMCDHLTSSNVPQPLVTNSGGSPPKRGARPSRGGRGSRRAPPRSQEDEPTTTQ